MSFSQKTGTLGKMLNCLLFRCPRGIIGTQWAFSNFACNWLIWNPGNSITSKRPRISFYTVFNGRCKLAFSLHTWICSCLEIFFVFLTLNVSHMYAIVKIIAINSIIPTPRRRWDLFKWFCISLFRAERHVKAFSTNELVLKASITCVVALVEMKCSPF